MSLREIGKTEDGRAVIGGMFSYYDSLGLPFSFVFDSLKKHDLQPSFLDLVQECRQAGWDDKTIFSRLEEAVVDSYGKEYWKVLESKFRDSSAGRAARC